MDKVNDISASQSDISFAPGPVIETPVKVVFTRDDVIVKGPQKCPHCEQVILELARHIKAVHKESKYVSRIVIAEANELTRIPQVFCVWGVQSRVHAEAEP